MTELSDAIKEYFITTSRDQVLKDHKEVQTRNNTIFTGASTIFIADRETPEDYRKHAFSKPLEPATSETMQELHDIMISEKLAANSIVAIPDYSAPKPNINKAKLHNAISKTTKSKMFIKPIQDVKKV